MMGENPSWDDVYAEYFGPPKPPDDDLRAEIKAALEGDSNDAEHDALAAVAEAFGITYEPPGYL